MPDPITPPAPVTPQTGAPQPATPPAPPPTPPATPPQGAEKPPQPAVPERYELKLPSGSTLDASVLDARQADYKARGFSQEQAQAELERENSNTAAYVKSQQDKVNQITQTQWPTEIKNDPELGGENYARNAEKAKRVMERFGTDAFKKILEDTGYGNNPEFFRFVKRISDAMSEDQLIIPGSHSPGQSKSMEDTFYPEKQKEK